MKIYCAPHNEQPNIFRTYREIAVADIQSEKRISELEAANLLLDSSEDNPIHLKDVDYWIES